MAETNGLNLLIDAVKISESADENSQVASNELRVRIAKQKKISFYCNSLVGLLYIKYDNEDKVIAKLKELVRTKSDKQIRKYQKLLYRELLDKYR